MNIKRLSGIQGAKSATDLAIIVDVMRAATVEAYSFGQGALFIMPVETEEQAFVIKKNHPDCILVGETGGVKIEGFDLGNSPTEIVKADLKNKVLVHRTSSGIQALYSAKKAQKIIFGSFVTISAIVNYIKMNNFKDISIVEIDNEDKIFGDFLEDLLLCQKTDKEKIRIRLFSHPRMQQFLDPKEPRFLRTDLELALQFDRFDFICFIERDHNGLISKKIRIDPI